MNIKIAGIHIQAPWSELICSGKKTVETRSYAVPEKHRCKPLAVIETCGRTRPSFKARIIGIVMFSESKLYKSEKEWRADVKRHLVPSDDPDFCFQNDKRKYGWEIVFASRLQSSLDSPGKRGIVFAKECEIPAKSLKDFLTSVTKLTRKKSRLS